MAANASSRPQPEEAATQADAACDLLRLPHSLWGALWAALQGDSGRITPEQHNLRRTCRAAARATAHLCSTCHLSTALRPCPPMHHEAEGQGQQPAAAACGLPCGSGNVPQPAQLQSACATMSGTDGKLWAATSGRLAAYPQEAFLRRVCWRLWRGDAHCGDGPAQPGVLATQVSQLMALPGGERLAGAHSLQLEFSSSGRPLGVIGAEDLRAVAATLTQLRHLALVQVRTSGPTLSTLSALPGLRELELRAVVASDAAELVRAVAGLTQLTRLRFDNDAHRGTAHPAISPDELLSQGVLGALTGLRELDLAVDACASGARATLLSQVAHSLPRLATLRLAGASVARASGKEPLQAHPPPPPPPPPPGQLPQLGQPSIRQQRAGQLPHLLHLAHLCSLSLPDDTIGPDGIRVLATLPALTRLSVAALTPRGEDLSEAPCAWRGLELEMGCQSLSSADLLRLPMGGVRRLLLPRYLELRVPLSQGRDYSNPGGDGTQELQRLVELLCERFRPARGSLLRVTVECPAHMASQLIGKPGRQAADSLRKGCRTNHYSTNRTSSTASKGVASAGGATSVEGTHCSTSDASAGERRPVLSGLRDIPGLGRNAVEFSAWYSDAVRARERDDD